MKRWISLFVLSIIPLLAASPLKQNPLNMYQGRFAVMYPNWQQYSPEIQATLIRIYLNSKNKYYWFPEHHEKPFNHYTLKK